MIRGISKRIIEINDTGSDFFEKAVFFVKPDSDKSDKALKNEADKIISAYFSNIIPTESLGYLRVKDSKQNKKHKLMMVVLGAVLTTAISAAIVFFF